eukprot:4965874-Pleurochrysis_carterae.AAC.1
MVEGGVGDEEGLYAEPEGGVAAVDAGENALARPPTNCGSELREEGTAGARAGLDRGCSPDLGALEGAAAAGGQLPLHAPSKA